MRAFRILPGVVLLSQVKTLSKDALRRLTWIDWYYTHGKNAEATCRHFCLSKSVFYRWFNRFDKDNLSTLEFDTKTRRPHRLREMTTDPVILQKIYEIRLNDQEKSKYEIHEELKKEGIKVAHNVIQKVINRHYELRNLNHKRSVKAKRKLSIARIKAARELKDKHPGVLIQIDTKHLYILNKRCYLFAAIDCKSRMGYIWAYKNASSLSAADFLLKAIKYFPFQIQAVNTDNGSEYLLNFHKLAENLGITHYFTYPHTPKMNARVERFIQTAQYEFFHYQDDLIPDLEQINQRCRRFNHKYNFTRLHRALDYQTPKEYVKNYCQQKGELPFFI